MTQAQRIEALEAEVAELQAMMRKIVDAMDGVVADAGLWPRPELEVVR